MTFLTKQTRVAILLMVIIGLLSMVLPAGAQGATIRYANWNLGTEEENNLQRQLVAAYVEANPGVTIEFVDMSGDGGWEEKLTNFAARGELPDVFMANNTPYYVQNGWAADLTAQVEADADWATIPQVLRNAVTYDGKVLGLPSAQFIMGYFINQDLFEAANLDAPQYGVSAEDFFAAASQLTDVQQGVLGLHEMGPILGWYPSTQDSNLGWFSFDGTHMNYNSDAFRSAVNTAIEMRPNTWQGLTDEQKTAFTAQGPWELFVNQESGAVWEGGWALPSYVQNATFNWDFIGIPGGNQAMVADLLVVSATAADQDAAYDFARWMSFSSAGYAKEAELATAAGLVPTRMPVHSSTIPTISQGMPAISTSVPVSAPIVMPPTSPTARTMSMVLTICATTWSSNSARWYNGRNSTMPSSMKSITSSSTKLVPPSSSPARPMNHPTTTKPSPNSSKP